MNRAWLVLVAACDTAATDPPWQLAHDRVVAVRVNPPHVPAGEVATFEVLLAHADGPTTIAAPVNASASGAPGGLSIAVHFYFDHWRVDGLGDEALAPARAELGLPAGAPVPIDVLLEVPGPLYARKTVWLGGTHDNPQAPALVHGPVLAPGAYPLALEVAPGWSVRWLTSCGSLEGETTSRAIHRVDEACEGELVVVVRDPLGGVAWQILPVRVAPEI